MKSLITIVIGLAYFGTCSVYTVIVAENIEQICRHYFEADLDIRIYIAVLLIPAILICWVPNLKYLAPLSMAANVITLVAIAITFYYCFTDMPSPSVRPLHISILDVPSFFGIAIFAMSAVGAALPLENKMAKPAQLTSTFGVLNIETAIVTTLYGFFGFFGFVRYGDSLKGSITLNLPTDEIPAQAVKIFIALAIFASIGIQFYVLVETIWNPIKHKFTTRPILANYILRTSLISVSVLLAVAVPTIGPFVSLIGAFCFSIINLLFPVVIEIFTYWHDGFGKYSWIIVKNVFIFCVGIIAVVIGTKEAISDIVNLYTVEKIQSKFLLKSAEN